MAMTKHDRLAIPELVAQSREEPDLRQVIVEGLFDVRFHRWLFGGLGVERAAFIEINSVDVPAEVVTRHGCKFDNHGRVVALALELNFIDPASAHGVRCFADGEYDYVLGGMVAAPTLDYLDATSPEAIALDVDVMEKFRLFHLPRSSPSADAIVKAVTPALQWLFAARTANYSLGWGLQWPGFAARVTDDGTVKLDETKFIDQYIGSARQMVDPPVFTDLASSILQRAKSLPLAKSIRGHDLGAIIGTAIRGHVDNEHKDICKPGVCERALLGCLEKELLLHRPPIKRLRDFLLVK